MMSYNKVNNIVGWLVFAIAAVVYGLTMEPSGSLWDCGEFVASCAKVQVPHPPGAPLFVLLGRLFVIPFGMEKAAFGVNLMSALSSAFTILFLFWTITHFAKKLVVAKYELPTGGDIITIIGAGAVGALAYTFSDSFWFSAVEGEVYAMSSFFTAIVFWLVCKWEAAVDLEHAAGSTARFTAADKWPVLVFYLMGLSIGVHLLNLLTIPAIVVLFYFKRYKPNILGTIIAFIVGCIFTGLVQVFVVKSSMSLAKSFDIFFKNNLGLPFFSGFGFFWIFLAACLAGAIYFANKNKFRYLSLISWCFVFMYLGFTTYFTTLIRSSANVALDMYNVDNPVALDGYLSREQYGDWPVLFGNDFNNPPPTIEGGMQYTKTDKEYIELGNTTKEDYANAEGAHIFPRMWQHRDDRGNFDMYQNFAGVDASKKEKSTDEITLGDNIKFFWNYQFKHMYFRYFMWNFAGKQNDNQGYGNNRDGNWISGIPFIDNGRLGDQSKLPESIGIKNKAHNKLYMLPFILGILGGVAQFMRSKKDFLITGLLFFFTGIAIVLYLNQQGMQPRERDYAFVGSFYAFCIWVGLSVVLLGGLLQKFINKKVAAIVATSLALLGAPVLMANQEWDDHDRSKKELAPDLAKNYLNSCPQNAVLICFGDNDTYPLWYAQEVLGIRKDIRVINYSLLSAEWYVHQLFQKVNDSEPIPLVFTKEQMRTGVRDQVIVMPGDANAPANLLESLKNITASDEAKYKFQAQGYSEPFNKIPSNQVYLPVDKNFVLENGIINKGDSALANVNLTIQSQGLMKSDLAILGIIAANNWKRPICFTSTQEIDKLGLVPYLRLNGLAYQFVPIANDYINGVAFYNNAMKFNFGNANKKGVYFDEENQRHLANMRQTFAMGAGYFASKGDKQKGRDLLKRIDEGIDQSNFPYGYTTNRGNNNNQIALRIYQSAVKCDDNVLAEKVKKSLEKDIKQQNDYYLSLIPNEGYTLEKLTTAAVDYIQYPQIIQQYNKMKAENPEEAKKYSIPPVPSFPEAIQAYAFELASNKQIMDDLNPAPIVPTTAAAKPKM